MIQWKTCFFFYCLLELSQQRTNLAQRHPCYPTNKRLEPFIQWNEHLISSQYGAVKDACEQTTMHNPVCCTNQILDSYTLSLANQLKIIFDAELDLLRKSFSQSNQQLELWIKEYINESRHLTISSLETIFGLKEYRYHLHHILITLFNTLGNHQSTDIQVANAINSLFNQLIISMYRHFMSNNQDLTFDHTFEKCLINQALNNNNIFPTQRELLYTLTSASSLMHIFRRLSLYIEVDIQRLKQTATFHLSTCLQRYTKEMLCPICADRSFSIDDDDDHHHHQGLCENNCQLFIGNCFNQTDNPYIIFAMNAQGYSNIIKQMQESIHELKLVERLSKFHIYLYDMIINATNTRLIYTKIQKLCPNSHEKSFQPIQSVVPIMIERRDLVNKWNESLHFMLNERQSSIINLNHNLTQQIVKDICSQSTYADQSIDCQQIDLPSLTYVYDKNLFAIRCIQQDHIARFRFEIKYLLSRISSFRDFSSSSPIMIDLNSESIKNQIDDLEKKLEPIQNMIISLRPRKKFSIHHDLPDLDYDMENQTNENIIETPFTLVDEHEDENSKDDSFSNVLYNNLDRKIINLTITTIDDNKKNKNNNQTSSSDFNDDSYIEEDDLLDITDRKTTEKSIITTTTAAAATTVEENINYSSVLTYNIKLYLIVFLLLLTN